MFNSEIHQLQAEIWDVKIIEAAYLSTKVGFYAGF